ncbi:hypothetical protein CHGG_10777 [Chaetomium globosum CBS 148.51]|uniref:Thymidylate kinase n=1 Tax=Chaetomium globosum (strain ATCC 6205 / CBS 148.51 / DSM 1962 / NBRC 6347 / NRRL 1970) TaxID=306901 RepID=Q2GMM7_CHAGB|nr:uncharacterized protein CHGG_10777 [Chaetomium globosum CBS 148.51]EAQ82959.1 hypothetical protein CHGG_10777 [Chaetomium globosum CBS 148.51]
MPATRRKASEVDDVDNAENVARALFSKRSKGADLKGDISKSFTKPPTFTLAKASPSPAFRDVLSTPSRPSSTPLSRNILKPKSPTAQLKAKTAAAAPAPSPLTAPAGRSPTRPSKRVGILSRRRNQRPDPPAFSLKAGVPFSLDTALKGTIPGYSGSSRPSKTRRRTTPASSAALDFFIPTADQASRMHGTCTLDISSDEESESRAKRDRAEGRDKENIPPPEDVSQTSSARGASRDAVDIDEDVLLLKGRGPLCEMNVVDFYADGCDSSSVFIIPGDEEDPEAVVNEGTVGQSAQQPHELPSLPEDGEEEQRWLAEERLTQMLPPQVSLGDVDGVDVDDIMGGSEQPQEAAGLGPIEGAGESFELWESNSAKDEGSAPASPSRPSPSRLDEGSRTAPVLLF